MSQDSKQKRRSFSGQSERDAVASPCRCDQLAGRTIDR